MQQHLIEVETADEAIYEGRIVKLHLKAVRLPNGETARREIVVHPGAIAIVPVLPDGQLILVRQYRTAARKVTLELPAGTLDSDEDPDKAAIRELREEIGYRPGRLERIGGTYTAPGYTTEYIHLYLAHDLEPAPLATDDDEFIEPVTMPLRAAIEKVMHGEIDDGKTVSGLLLAARRLEL